MAGCRLLYVFPEPLPLRKARAVQVVNTVRALAEAGLDVDFAYVPVAHAADPFAHYGMVCPANVRLVPLSRGLPQPFSGLRLHSNRFFLWRLRRWYRRQQWYGAAPDVVFARHVKLASGILESFPGLPLVYEAHEVFSQPAPKLYGREKQVIERSTVVIAITRALAEALNRHFGLQREYAIIPSATALPENVGNKDWTAAAREIVYAGSFYGWKGTDDLIAAAQWLPGCRITLIGGDDKGIARLRGQVPAGGAEVIFAGHMSHQEVWERLDAACIAVLPNRAGSVSEFTSPLKLFEYMAAGCAVVASDLPVLREVLADDEVAWFPAGDPLGMAKAIRLLADDPISAQAMGGALAVKARNFTWEARAKRLRAVVEKACGRNGGCRMPSIASQNARAADE